MVNTNPPATVYLIPGQGADERLFKNLALDSSLNVVHIKYTVPEQGMTMAGYAQQLANQIDTTESFALVGVSLGGMLCVEMTEFLNPSKTIIISSAQSWHELPGRYRFQQSLPLNQWVPKGMYKAGALLLQPIVEPDRNKEKETCIAMLKDKDPLFLKRTVNMIINWDRRTAPSHVVHIHGDSDHTLPISNTQPDYTIAEGSHMMVLTRGEEISELINNILTE